MNFVTVETGKAIFLSIKTTNETAYVFDFYTNDKIFEFFSDKSIVWYLAFGGSVQDVDKYTFMISFKYIISYI